MRNKVLIAAAASALILSAIGASADETSFQAPSTTRAQQTLPLLTKAARAVGVSARREADRRITNLWLYPTDASDTVFAQYTLVSDKNPRTSSAHLELLRLKGSRIVERQELNGTRESGLLAQQPHAAASHAFKNSRITNISIEEK